MKIDSELKKKDDKSFFFTDKINQTFKMTMSELKTKTTLVRIKNEGCPSSFHSSPHLTRVVLVQILVRKSA